jgi:hypothetical protein
MNPNTENSEFCEQFVNNLGMITLVEAGLDWNLLEAQSAHNQSQTKDFPSFSGFYLGERNESCTAHQFSQPLTRTTKTVKQSLYLSFYFWE